uniref:Uncharacterized protein n=1 Tax=Anguilla anguilla TaxID=7936 RepID=A0A0E9U5K8_ANGAN
MDSTQTPIPYTDPYPDTP